MSIEHLKQTFGNRLYFHRAINQQHLLPLGSVAQVTRKVRETIEILGRSRDTKSTRDMEMDKQRSFSDIEFAGKKKTTKREAFLQKMDSMIPWKKWVAIIEECYPKGERGRPPMGAEKMLRMYLLQLWFNLSDEAIEDSLYDIQPMRQFVGINLLTEAVPDATTLLKFRHLLEQHGVMKRIFGELNLKLVKSGKMMKGGTIVDATIIDAPSSTKNEKKERDPDCSLRF